MAYVAPELESARHASLNSTVHASGALAINHPATNYIEVILMYRRASLSDAKTIYAAKIMLAVPTRFRITLRVFIMTSFMPLRHFL